jgi:hypothetical protein
VEEKGGRMYLLEVLVSPVGVKLNGQRDQAQICCQSLRAQQQGGLILQRNKE